MYYTYKNICVCSRKIFIELDGNKIVDVQFEGGCDGNTKGLINMVKGLDANEVIGKLKGIKCGHKTTSCPDQLAIALEKAIKDKDI
ncbi:MAG: TIGR03905 family TSCPD domain-containing protein [Oscillospiraceae bacterium]|nr:TIGR03905 family TSCPD domain-containing protein [Oscillospiraceae bacterium]